MGNHVAELNGVSLVLKHQIGMRLIYFLLLLASFKTLIQYITEKACYQKHITNTN